MINLTNFDREMHGCVLNHKGDLTELIPDFWRCQGLVWLKFSDSW